MDIAYLSIIVINDNDSSLGEVPIESEAVAQKCRETPMGQQE